jgi:hypothetical protein
MDCVSGRPWCVTIRFHILLNSVSIIRKTKLTIYLIHQLLARSKDLKRVGQLLFIGILFLTTGCASTYRTLKVDAQAGLYPTNSQLDPGATTVYDTSVDLRAFPIVLLITDTNLQPSVFEFTVRTALAQAGIINVFSSIEFFALAKSKGIDVSDSRVTPAIVRSFSSRVAPVLSIEYSLEGSSGGQKQSTLVVTDTRTNRPLLQLDQKSSVGDINTGAMYPVLNQLRRWIKASTKGQV